MNLRFRRALFFGILGVLVAGALLGLDYGVRQVYLGFRSEPADGGPKFPREKHPYYHHGLKPNAAGIDTYGSLRAPYFSNSLGLRDGRIRTVSSQPSGGRILLIGDSFTEGIGVPWGETFAGLLAEEMAKRGAEVLNAGVASSCPAIELARLRWLIERQGLKLDRVVLFLDIADLRDELSYETLPDGSIRETKSEPLAGTTTADPRNIQKLRQRHALFLWAQNNLEENFVLLGALARNLRLSWEKHGAAGGVRAADLRGDWGGEWPDYQGPMEGQIEAGLAKTKVSMGDLKKYLDSLGIPLTLVIYPWPQQIRSGTRPSRMETEWQAWARRHSVPLINLFPRLVGNPDTATDTIQTYYIAGDFHWNRAGHAKVAQILLSPEILPLWTGRGS